MAHMDKPLRVTTPPLMMHKEHLEGGCFGFASEDLDLQTKIWIRRRGFGFADEDLDSQTKIWIRRRGFGFADEDLDSQTKIWIRRRRFGFADEDLDSQAKIGFAGEDLEPTRAYELRVGIVVFIFQSFSAVHYTELESHKKSYRNPAQQQNAKHEASQIRISHGRHSAYRRYGYIGSCIPT
ncbi:MAG TPA: hypothetical protein V6C76_00055 [Drouetiella sp.]